MKKNTKKEDLQEMYKDATETIEVLHEILNNMWKLNYRIMELLVKEIEGDIQREHWE